MRATRDHVLEEAFHATPERLFALLVTPSAICSWWSAASAIVMPCAGGLWAARWGAEDDPDYVTSATLEVFEPPRRLVMADYAYWAKSGPLPFEAEFRTEFLVTARDGGASLRVTQAGFPAGPEGDEFYAGCQQGWRDTFAGIRRFLEGG